MTTAEWRSLSHQFEELFTDCDGRMISYPADEDDVDWNVVNQRLDDLLKKARTVLPKGIGL